MSYIRETLQCTLCKKYINVSVGTFGGGVPQRCVFCNAPNTYELYADGVWWASESGEIDKTFEESREQAVKDLKNENT